VIALIRRVDRHLTKRSNYASCEFSLNKNYLKVNELHCPIKDDLFEAPLTA